MGATKNGDKIYVYTMRASGEVVERVGVVSNKRKKSKLMLVTFQGGQRMCLSTKAAEIHNSTMWSVMPMKNVYVSKMIDVLLERKLVYEERLLSTNRRLTVLKGCWRNEGCGLYG